MDGHAKAALTATKRLYKHLHECQEAQAIGALEISPGNFVDWTALKTLAADANKAVQALRKHAASEALRADVREAILREAIHHELIDREANAARVLDKQRAINEGTRGEAAFERAQQAATAIEQSIATLCPHQTAHSPGVALLAAAAEA